MEKMKIILGIYFDFHYGIACALGIFIFCIYLFGIRDYLQGQLAIKKIVSGMLFSAYVALLIGGTVLNRTIGSCVTVDINPFWSYRETFVEKNVDIGIQIVSNIVIFIPWGILMSITFERMKRFVWNFAGATVFSATVELVQFVLRCGKCELDDVFHNAIGAIIGYGIWKIGCIICGKMCKRYRIQCTEQNI